MHMIDPDRYVLHGDEKEHLEILKRVFVIISEHPLRAESMKLIQELEGYSGTRTPYRLYQEAQDLFGRFADNNRKLERMLQRERILQLIEMAKGDLDEDGKPQKKVDLGFILECEKLFTKITGTDNHEEADNTPQELPPVMLTSEVSVLLESQAEDAEIDD